METPSEQENVESELEHTHKSWKERHGATIIAVTVAVMLVLLIALNS